MNNFIELRILEDDGWVNKIININHIVSISNSSFLDTKIRLVNEKEKYITNDSMIRLQRLLKRGTR